MTAPLPRSLAALTLLGAAVSAAACAGSSGAPSEPAAPASGTPSSSPAPVIQPGAPGQASRTFDSDDLSGLVGVDYSDADVRFMQGMIPHHAQALEMTALVEERTRDEGFRQLTLRMEISQRDEIAMMESWLERRGEAVRAPGGHGAHQGHEGMAGMAGGSGMELMPGMLTPDQMADLRAAEGVAFERLFLEYMIQHHEGAITMVRELFNTSGAGQESEVFQFASHVDADQTMEIRRMRAMLERRR